MRSGPEGILAVSSKCGFKPGSIRKADGIGRGAWGARDWMRMALVASLGEPSLVGIGLSNELTNRPSARIGPLIASRESKALIASQISSQFLP
jgi:hypothetical protein